MLVSVSQVDDAPGFWLPPDNPNRDAAVISESPVELTHNDSPLRRHTPTIAAARLWLHATQRPDTMRSYRNDEVP